MYLASDLEIFLSQIFIEPMGCWRWTGLRGNGYGFLNKKLAHRFACGILRTTLWRKRKNVPHNL